MKNGELWTKALIVVLLATLAGTAQAGLKAQWLFNEGAGTTAADATGHGYTGTLVNAGWAAGRYGNAVTFDGLNDNSRVTINDPTDALSPGNLTGGVGGWSLSIWAKGDLPPTGDNWVLYHKEADAMNFSFLRIMDSGAIRFWYEVNDVRLVSPAITSTALGTFVPNQWNHIVVVIDAAAEAGSQLHIYLNGVEVSGDVNIDLTTPLTLAGSQTAFGNETVNAAGTLYGEMAGALDDARIYDNALSATDVAALYNLGAPVNHSPADGATDVALDTNLSWTANPMGDGGSYDVYLGTDPQALSLVLENTAALSYNPPADLSYAATYYWRVDGVETGDVLSFSTLLWDNCTLTAEDGDLDGDCLVTLEDFAIMANNWLKCGWVPETLCP